MFWAIPSTIIPNFLLLSQSNVITLTHETGPIRTPTSARRSHCPREALFREQGPFQPVSIPSAIPNEKPLDCISPRTTHSRQHDATRYSMQGDGDTPGGCQPLVLLMSASSCASHPGTPTPLLSPSLPQTVCRRGQPRSGQATPLGRGLAAAARVRSSLSALLCT